MSFYCKHWCKLIALNFSLNICRQSRLDCLDVNKYYATDSKASLTVLLLSGWRQVLFIRDRFLASFITNIVFSNENIPNKVTQPTSCETTMHTESYYHPPSPWWLSIVALAVITVRYVDHAVLPHRRLLGSRPALRLGNTTKGVVSLRTRFVSSPCPPAKSPYTFLLIGRIAFSEVWHVLPPASAVAPTIGTDQGLPGRLLSWGFCVSGLHNQVQRACRVSWYTRSNAFRIITDHRIYIVLNWWRGSW